MAALPGGFWWNEEAGYWLDTHGRRTSWHRIAALGRLRTSRVMLVCVRLALPTDGPVGLVALCRTCLMAHRAAAYRMTRRLARLRRYALGDLFDGPYPATIRI